MQDVDQCALFWDFASVPQKDEHGERTAEERAVFKRAMPVMNKLYASICGTTVIQFKDIPPRPAEYDGRVIIFDLHPSSTDEEAVRADLSRFGTVVEVAVEGSVATARFASHEEAEHCVATLHSESRGAGCLYNETCYSRDCGEPYSGWCSAEQGSSSFVAAHFAKAERQAAQRSLQLPARFAHAQARRAKVTDISGGLVRTVSWDMEPAELLEQTFDAIEGATFVGKGDREFVQFLLADFEWVIRSAMLLATEQAQSEHDLSAEPAMARRLKRCLARLNDMRLCLGTFWRHTSGSEVAVSLWRRHRTAPLLRSITPLRLPPLIRQGSGSSLVAALSQQELANYEGQEVTSVQVPGMSIELSRSQLAQVSRRESTSSRGSRRYEALDDDMEAQQDDL